jgi:hypothetical protein
MRIFDKLFKKESSEEELEKFFEKKGKVMDSILGEQFHLVFHVLIPFCVGVGVNMYIYPNTAVGGTAFTTKELIESADRGPIPNRNGHVRVVDLYKA